MLASTLRSSAGPLQRASGRSARLRLSAVLATPGPSGTSLATVAPQRPSTQLTAPSPDAVYVDSRGWAPVNLAKATLVELAGIPLQKTTESGFNLTISYDPALDELIVIDYAKGLRFPAVFGVDNKVRVDVNGPVPTAVIGLSFEALSQVHEPSSAASAGDWASLPADLLFRVVSQAPLLLPDVLLACCAWHRALKAVLTELRPHCLGSPALGLAFTSVRSLEAPLLRRTSASAGGFHISPLRSPQRLAALFPSLVSLDISHQDFGLPLLQPLAGRLQQLRADGCPMGSPDIALLACCTQLTSLALNGLRAALAAELAITLSGLSRLRHLELCLEEAPPEEPPRGGPGAATGALAGGLPPDPARLGSLRGLPLTRLAGCLTALTGLT
ncbi:hypothetical protein TSOC_013570 [Tetrabaena socialis]|uniref:F-box domain-containing protein n=1 Tax=Tetrabaena socialis TaxID=47790 RepID=A0A2J7ZK15_9CHLO|nr:hypothetical protein TSOC_013570 [Tetrabaena socialis]|eukprot:PNH00600.1 hypothetical protein TSOC_013570 [Tetrabaena socialis]